MAAASPMGFTLGISGSASNRLEMATFSATTLSKFADACASIPIRPLDRAFDRAGIRAGITDDDSGGARRTRFRQYLSTIDQKNARQLQQLGDALGALIEEAATSKQPFLIAAAEGDGFEYVNGAFRVASTAAASFAISRLDDTAGLDDRIRRLQVLAQNHPAEATAGVRELVRSVSQLAGGGFGVRGTRKSSTVVRNGLQSLAELVDGLDEPVESNDAQEEVHRARLAVDCAAAFAAYVAGSTARTPSKAGNKRR